MSNSPLIETAAPPAFVSPTSASTRGAHPPQPPSAPRRTSHDPHSVPPPPSSAIARGGLAARRGVCTKLAMPAPRGRLAGGDTSKVPSVVRTHSYSTGNLNVLRYMQDGGPSSPGEPDLVFTYGDSDTYVNELREIYAYAELCDFTHNADAWKAYADLHKVFTNHSLLNNVPVAHSCPRIGHRSPPMLAEPCCSRCAMSSSSPARHVARKHYAPSPTCYRCGACGLRAHSTVIPTGCFPRLWRCMRCGSNVH